MRLLVPVLKEEGGMWLMEWEWEGGVGRGVVITVGRLEEASTCWKLIGHSGRNAGN